MLEIVQLRRRGRRVKFTPERIEQIKNLVERGKHREEIAALIGVTVGSLQVTCSRLGISLRPSKLAKAADAAHFAISMRYRGEERAAELPLTQDMIRQLAAEAALRGVPISDLIGDLIMGTLQAHARKEAAPVPSWAAEAEPAPDRFIDSVKRRRKGRSAQAALGSVELPNGVGQELKITAGLGRRSTRSAEHRRDGGVPKQQTPPRFRAKAGRANLV